MSRLIVFHCGACDRRIAWLEDHTPERVRFVRTRSTRIEHMELTPDLIHDPNDPRWERWSEPRPVLVPVRSELLSELEWPIQCTDKSHGVLEYEVRMGDDSMAQRIIEARANRTTRRVVLTDGKPRPEALIKKVLP